MAAGRRVLIIESRLYGDIANNLVKGAVEDLSSRGVGYKRIIVPGVLDIPPTIRYAIRAMELRATDVRYAGYIVLGCILREKEQLAADALFRESVGGTTRLASKFSLAIGNGIIIADTHGQAIRDAAVNGGNAGGKAAATCLRMMDVKREFGL